MPYVAANITWFQVMLTWIWSKVGHGSHLRYWSSSRDQIVRNWTVRFEQKQQTSSSSLVNCSSIRNVWHFSDSRHLSDRADRQWRWSILEALIRGWVVHVVPSLPMLRSPLSAHTHTHTHCRRGNSSCCKVSVCHLVTLIFVVVLKNVFPIDWWNIVGKS